jgi:thiol-disulfide isomerase/thioredoxin
MKSILSRYHRRAVPQRLVNACLIVIFSYAITLAQEKVNYCEPSPAVNVELKKISEVFNEGLPYKQRRERQSAMIRELSNKFPDDFHVLKRLQEDRRGADEIDREAFISEYRARMEKREGDPASVYFYARLLIGNNTKEAVDHLNKLTQQFPEFPWSYLALAEIYYYPKFRDNDKSQENLKKWMTICTSRMDGFNLLLRGNHMELIGETAKSLRMRLEASPAEEDLRNWENLWTLEFKLKPVLEHPQVRRKVEEDLKVLRARNFNTKEWLSLLQAGYKMTDDKEGRTWAENEMLRLFPKSVSSLYIIRTRWRDEHPSPKAEDPAEKKQAYYQALLKATDEELKQWPDEWYILQSRFTTINEIENSTGNEIEEAGEKYLAAMRKNVGEVRMLPPPAIAVAQAYAKRKVATARIPPLVLEGLEEVERMDKRSPPSDLYPHEGRGNGNLKSVQWQSWPVLAEAYAKLGQGDKAREVLKKMEEALRQDKPGEKAKASDKSFYSTRQVTYWQTNGKVAEADNRKLDALSSYQTALSFRLKSPTPRSGMRDELADGASRLWKELGGTDEGLQAYLARNDASKRAVESTEVATWDAKVQPLPDFTLVDIRGKKWQLADLKGKVTFINLWATWCGPCVAELPYVQKLHDQMKDNKDVLVLTLNIDSEPIRIEPFMRDNKYSFTVIPAQEYATGMDVFSIPRNWVVNAGGTIQFEGLGFGGEGDKWMEKATEMIRKVQGGK